MIPNICRPTDGMMTLKSIRIISAFALFSAAGLAQGDSSRARSTSSDVSPFLGKWQLDKKKTQAKGAPEDLQCEIKEQQGGLLIKSKYQEPKNALYPILWVGVMTYELPLSTDGTEKQTQIGPYMHTSKTSINGNSMTTEWNANLANQGTDTKGNVEGKWIRTVSPDGKEMTLEIIAKASDGRNMDQTLVLHRR
jgi:hypothetical protein